MIFPRCSHCGVVAVACTCAFATVHAQSFCGLVKQGGTYCSMLGAELPHTPHHHDLPISGGPAWIGTVALTTSPSTVVFGGETIPDHPSMTWSVKKIS